MAALIGALTNKDEIQASHRLHIFEDIADLALNLNGPPRRIVSTVAEAERLGYAISSFVRNNFTTMGATVYYVNQLVWGSMVSHLCNLHDTGVLDIVVDMTMIASDETTLSLSMWEKTEDATDLALLGDSGFKCGGWRRRKRSQMSKILETEVISTIGVRWKGSNKFEIISVEFPCKLVVADSMTGSTLYRAWQSITDSLKLGSPLQERANVRLHVSCSDRGSANGKANRIGRYLLPGALRFSDAGCVMHNLHIATRHTIKPFRQV